MILATHWVILWESRNILKENTLIISNGFVRNAPKDMMFNQITRLTSKPVELEAIPVIVAVFAQESPPTITSSHISSLQLSIGSLVQLIHQHFVEKFHHLIHLQHYILVHDEQHRVGIRIGVFVDDELSFCAFRGFGLRLLGSEYGLGRRKGFAEGGWSHLGTT
ncbi:Uncharacterized protein Fot_42544 [Forsythia ovata]|uniref:Uncharacterized protein n=1 Tax=Forsythia ovata TaxID=205694 RepID=A0ABD1RLH9_9LAMI